jgi:hypothetical protein
MSGMWFGVIQRTNSKRHVFKETKLRAQDVVTIVGSIVDIIRRAEDPYMNN